MLRFDLHVHSNFSRDGYDSIDSILKRAKEIGLNGIAITDHNTIEGGLTGAKMAGALGLDLMVIPGVCLIHFIHFAMDWVTFQRVQMPSRCTTLGASQGIRIGVRGTQQHVWA